MKRILVALDNPPLLVMPDSRLEDVLRGGVHADLDRLASSVRPELVERITTSIGTAWDAIVRAGRELDADVTVV